MKTLFSFSFILLAFTGFSQLPDQITDKTASAKPAAPQCRELMMVRDCSGYVYSEFYTIDGREEEVILHAKSGKPFTGECKVCYNTGYLKMHLNYVNGRLVGKDTIYYENGNINLITSHDEDGFGKEDGTWKFYREDGSLKWEKKYELGLAQGEHRYYFPDTTIWKIETFKDNQLHGKKQEYFNNHTLKKEIEYKNGKWDGKYITYFKDGKVESEQEYIRGLKDGPSSYYYQNGELFYTENHEMNSREDTFKRFYATGRMWTVENYNKDSRDGEFEEFYDNEKNTIKYKATYKKGELLYEMYYDEFGGEVMSPERIAAIKKAKAEAEAKAAGSPSSEEGEEGGATENESKKTKNKKKK